jgi:hypothetical protein
VDLQRANAVMALKLGIITWFQYFEIIKALPVIALLLLTACGSNSTPNANGLSCSTLAGHYNNEMVAGTMDISNVCTLSDSYCGYNISYTVPTSLDNGTSVISVIGTNGTPGCMSSTDHMCVVELIDNQLGVNCDSGAHIFLFTKL